MKNVTAVLMLVCTTILISIASAQVADGPATGYSEGPRVLNPLTIARGQSQTLSKTHTQRMAPLETINRLRNVRPNRDITHALNIVDSSTAHPRFGATSGNLYRTFEGLSNTNAPAPPDPYIAAGINHVVVVVNSRVAAYRKDGTVEFNEFLRDWFSDVHPPTDMNEPFDLE
jgi:hypothetical protein